MSETFLGEIRLFAGNYAPRNWAFCDGQIIQVSQNSALYSLLSNYYGGDGRSTFALPDMRGRLPVHQGSGPGLTNRPIGARYGQEGISLTTSQIPSHSHSLQGSSDSISSNSPMDNVPATFDQSDNPYITEPDSTDAKGMASGSVSDTGTGEEHSNMMPFLCINFIISLVGIYPSRN